MLEVSEAEFDRIYNVNVKSIYLMTQATTPRVARGRRRLGHQHRLDRRPPAAPGTDLVQRLQGIRESGLEIDGGGAGAAENPGQLHRAGARPDRAHRGFPRRPGDAGAAGGVHGTIPLGRMSKASDIAAAAVYLASDEAEFITGVVLPVDGGRTI